MANRIEQAHKKFLDACVDCGTDPTVEQTAILSVGSEFLPEHARTVRDGGEPTEEYWAWLAEQTLQAQNESDAEVAAGHETT